jgi:hypothetical protein
MNRILQALLLLPIFASVPIVVGGAEGKESQQDRVGETEVVVVTTTTASPTMLPDIALPVLPVLSDVDFVGMARAEHGKCGEWYDLAISVGWPEEEWKTLSQILWRESKCQPDAWSGSDAGLAQINQVHTEWAAMMGMQWPEDLFDPRNNLLFAYRLWDESGWKPWRFSGTIPGDTIAPTEFAAQP